MSTNASRVTFVLRPEGPEEPCISLGTVCQKGGRDTGLKDEETWRQKRVSPEGR